MTSAEVPGALRFSALHQSPSFGRRHFRSRRVQRVERPWAAGCWTITTTMAQTTLDDWAKDPVDPEIRAHVYSLITAVSSCNNLIWCSM